MKCKTVQTELRNLTNNHLTNTQRKQVEKHLAACETCCTKYQNILQSKALLMEIDVPQLSEQFDVNLQAKLAATITKSVTWTETEDKSAHSTTPTKHKNILQPLYSTFKLVAGIAGIALLITITFRHSHERSPPMVQVPPFDIAPAYLAAHNFVKYTSDSIKSSEVDIQALELIKHTSFDYVDDNHCENNRQSAECYMVFELDGT